MGAYGRCIGATLVVVAAIMAACSGAASGATPAAPSPTYASDSVLVAFKPGASVSQRAAAVRAAGASQRRGLGRLAGNAEQLVLARGQRVEGALARLRANPAVRYAEPDYIVTTQETSNDPYLTDGRLWGMLGSFGTHAADAWAAGAVGSRDVYIGVIDEGIEIAHPDLAANVWTNPYDPLDGIDNDGNGFVDDTNGWDFAGGNRTVYDGTNDDHGTHVAGTIGAVGGNGVGVAGMNWRVTMISTKFLGARGGTTSNAVRALDYLVDLKRRHGLNIVATSNSWGGGSYSQTLADAINRSGDAGMLFIAAAGNDGTSNDSTPHYPSNYECTTRFDTKASRGYDCVVSVASITDQGAKSSFSNYGAVSVDLGAPGSAIYSTLPSGTYGSYSGTSMATPHVSGAVALCAAAAPTFTASDIRSMLIATSALTASLANITTTGARLDAGTLAASCASGAAPAPDTTAPSAPSDLSGTAAGSSTVSLAWSAATDDRGVAGYRIWRSSDSGRVQLADVVGTSATDSGLSAATTYTYEVAAFDAAGNVGPSVSAQVTTGSAVLPGAFGKSAPADGATGLGTTVTLSWSTSTGASSYLVCVDTVDDGACNATWTSVGTALKATLRASRTRTYFWQVRAANAAGTTDADGGRWWRLTTR